MRRLPAFILALILILTALLCGRWVGLRLDRRQVESVLVFCALVLGVLLFDEHKLAISMGGVAGVLGLGLLTVDQLVAKSGLDVVLFLLGTYLVAGYLEQSLFFDHVASQIVRLVGPRPQALMAALMLTAMISSGIVGEVAAILFVGGAMLQIARRCELRPGPLLMILVFAVNTGSAASAFGPVGATIALKTHLGVMDFFRWALPISLAVLVLVFGICRWRLAADWKTFTDAVHRHHDTLRVPDPTGGKSGTRGWLLVLCMAIPLVFHEQIEAMAGLSPYVIFLAAPLAAGAVALVMAGKQAREIIELRVDWATLSFFLMLFAVVGALEESGLTSALADWLIHRSGGKPASLVLAVGWATGGLSALLANLLAVAAFLPVVAQIKSHGIPCPAAIYWLMLFGATFMGNMTSIGSTCNIVANGMATRRGHEAVSMSQWFKTGLLVSLASMALATLLLALQTDWLTR